MVQFNVPNCFSGDCDCQGTPPPGTFCPYGDCFSCIPSQCDTSCCCCASIDIVLDVRSRCFDRIFYSCNIDGTSSGPGQTPFPPGCPQCFDACNRALGGQEACLSISQHVGNPAWQPSPPDWWGFPPSIGPCECTCAEFVDPSNPGAGCNLTCVTCSGLTCVANVDVQAGNCNYQFNLTPSTGCCGTPALVDTVFCIDFSGSMEPFIIDVINNVEQIVDKLSTTGGLARFGLIVYGKAENDVTINTFSNGEILTEDVDDFKNKVNSNLPTSGGDEPDFDAVEAALTTFPWTGVENLIFLIGDEKVDQGDAYPIRGDFGNPTGQPSASMLIDLANRLGVTIITAQHQPPHERFDSRKRDLALGTNGKDVEITQPFSDTVDDLNLNVFGASCDCLDFTPIPIQLCTGGTGPNGDECIDPDPNVPIRKCVNEDNSDCNCNEPLSFDVCGEIITVIPDEDTLNLVCCSDIEGGGCACPSDAICPEGCCGVNCGNIDICSDFQNVQDAIDSIWCECWQKAIDGEFVLETPGCTRCTIPDPEDPNYDDYDIDALLNCTIKICDGHGGFFTKTRSEIVAEVEAAWAGCQRSDEEPTPPSVDEGQCLPNCDQQDECIVGDLDCPDNENQDIRECRRNICSNPHKGCVSTRNPATTILNNGIGLVAYESMEDNSVIKIDQFNTSLPGKILPNRRTNYGRLQHELRWENGVGIKLAKLYYYEEIPSHFINGVEGIPPEGTLTDMITFQTGPLQNQCFSLYATPLGEDDIGNFIQFIIPEDYTLSNPFPSLDDVYDIEWFIIDSDDSGLTGSAQETSETPGSDFLLEPNQVNTKLSLSPHIHDGSPVPVANPSIAVAHNYMNAIENSHFVYLVYQALEDGKWNLYMRQLRLSEYARENIIDSATPVSLANLGITEVIYRAVCITDNCSTFGNNFLATRTIAMEVVLPDGRDVFNQNLINSKSSWPICPGSPAGSYLKKKVYVELTHSAIVNKCPDQFEFNDLFYNWESGDEFSVPFSPMTSQELFILLRKPNDNAIELSEDTQVISGITITSSHVGAVWYEDPTIDTWVTPDTETFQEILQYKGLDVSEPIPITEFEIGHCTHPVVKVNCNNDVFVVYECTDPTLHQIHIVGTSVPNSSLPLGVFNPRNIDNTLDYFFSPSDFTYRSSITVSGEGINQLPDMFIDPNDVIHLTWQSNRDNYWEIYYAKSDDQFQAKRITDFPSKSLKPSITGDVRGNLYIVWHDNRFGNWEILMAYRDDERIETLYEQDPYLAGVRNEGYSHSTDIVPLILRNPSFTDPLCVSNLSVRFFEDRFKTLSAFEILQSEFPFAFQVPGMISDRTTVSWNDIGGQWTISPSQINILGTDYDHYIPIERSIDTQLVGSYFDTIKLEFSTQPQFIRFIANAYIDENAELEALKQEAIANGQNPDVLTLEDTQWIIDIQNNDNWVKIDHITSGEIVNVEDLIKQYFATQPFNLPNGRYKRVEILNSGTFDVTLVEIISVLKNRLCIAPQETVTAFLDLTPNIRIDKEGNEVIENPLPIKIKKNRVYFIGILGTNDAGQLVVFDDQKRTVSCESCIFTTTPLNVASCTYTITFNNSDTDTSAETRFFNARVRFYTDKNHTNLVAQFDTFSDGQLECFTVDNNISAKDVWSEEGLEVFFGQQRKVQLWPLLSNDTGLLCGIQYWVDTEICSGNKENPCSRMDLESVSQEVWICDCSSSRWSERFGEAPTNIRDIIRWKSSGDGFADTRLTETGSANNFNPKIRMRSDFTGIVLYESNRNDPNQLKSNNDVYEIYGTAFTVFPGSNMYASGSEAITSDPGELLIRSDIPIIPCNGSNCDDCSDNEPTCNAIQGRNVAFNLDQYDNLFLAVEQQNNQANCEALTKDKQQSILVHRCGIHAKNLNFTPEEQEGAGIFACSGEKILGTTAPLVTDKTFKKIIKLARINNKFAAYHITRSKRPAAVVEQCNVVIDIITQPETIAVRLRNENDAWSTWYPFDPEIGNYTISIPWTLSPMSGIKTITIQAATYQGLSASATITVVADYKGIDHTIQFYKLKTPTAPVPGFGELSNTTLLNFLDIGIQQGVFDKTNMLPTLEGIPVAGIRQPTVVDNKLVKQTSEFVYVEIRPSLTYIKSLGFSSPPSSEDAKNFPTFDVLQQGDEDLFSLPTIFNEERNAFQGIFPVRKDNMTFYQDGLSFVIPHFKFDCSDIASEISAETQYIRDKFNQPIPGGISTAGTTEVVADIWENERNEIGEIKYKKDIRGNEDPYFVFGDPDYRLKKRDE